MFMYMFCELALALLKTVLELLLVGVAWWALWTLGFKVRSLIRRRAGYGCSSAEC